MVPPPPQGIRQPSARTTRAAWPPGTAWAAGIAWAAGTHGLPPRLRAPHVMRALYGLHSPHGGCCGQRPAATTNVAPTARAAAAALAAATTQAAARPWSGAPANASPRHITASHRVEAARGLDPRRRCKDMARQTQISGQTRHRHAHSMKRPTSRPGRPQVDKGPTSSCDRGTHSRRALRGRNPDAHSGQTHRQGSNLPRLGLGGTCAQPTPSCGGVRWRTPGRTWMRISELLAGLLQGDGGGEGRREANRRGRHPRA